MTNICELLALAADVCPCKHTNFSNLFCPSVSPPLLSLYRHSFKSQSLFIFFSTAPTFPLKMAKSDDSTTAGSLHILMFPFVAFGHIIPFLQLSRKLSSAGIKITFLSTPANLPRIASLLPSSSTIRLISLPLPSVPGLPAGAESTADLPLETGELLKIAVDKMKPQVASLLAELRPELVFFEFAQPWIPSIAHPLGVKTLFFSLFSALTTAYLTVPARRNHSAGNVAVLSYF